MIKIKTPKCQTINRIRPPFVRSISAMTGSETDTIYYVDDIKGTLNRISVVSQENIGIVNHLSFTAFQNSTALWVEASTIQYAAMNKLITLRIDDGKVHQLSSLILKEMDQIIGIEHQQGLCFMADRNGMIAVYDDNMVKVKSWDLNININSMTFHRDEQTEGLYFLDEMNRSVYVYDLQGNHLFSITLPHEGATSIASVFSSRAKEPMLYISYVRKTWEIYDDVNPESEDASSLNIQVDKKALNVFFEPLCYKHKILKNNNSLCLSNGYRVEFKYFSMLLPIQEVATQFKKLKPSVRMCIPINTERQTVVSIDSLGQVHGNLIKDDDGEDIIEFTFPNMNMDQQRVVFGYKAVVDLYNIRYLIECAPFPSDFPDEVKKFLSVVEKLDMHRSELQKIAAGILFAMPEECSRDILKVVKAIREYVYAKLEYRYNSRETSPLQTLIDGEGTCGKYTELFLGLMRLCGVPCRAVGDYKVPEYKLEYGILNSISRPDYDHVWIEFFVPDVGWVPMESSSDDLPGRHDRFFAALPWVHIENSRTNKSREVVIPGTWKALDDRFSFSDYFEHEITITVTDEL